MDRQLQAALAVLGVPPDSDRGTVTRAYRRLARETHPDVSADPAAAERFEAVTAAYRLLSTRPLPAPCSRPRAGNDTARTEAGAGPLLLGVSPAVGAWSWLRPPVVAGPVVVRRSARDDGTGHGHG